MLIDARTLPDGSQIEADLCVVGAGAVGITLARELSGRNLRVCILESGGTSFDGRIQALCVGNNVGQPYQPLDACRLRFFGGSTNHWMGSNCALLDIDFEKRDWVPHSGWPFARRVLDPYYERARFYLDLDERGFESAAWERAGGYPPFHPGLEKLETRIYEYRPVRFGTRFREDIERSKNVSVYLHATTLEIETNEAATTVTGLRAGTLEGKRFAVKGRSYVLATGGLENPRLLLLSNRQRPRGLGNDHDLVGRFFMEHLDLRTGIFVPLEGGIRVSDLYFNRSQVEVDGRQIRGFVALPDAVLREQRLLGTSIIFEPLQHEGRAPIAALHVTAEQSPNPESRVFLTPDRDAFGLQRVDLAWRPSALDKRSLIHAHRAFATEFGRLGIGRIRFDLARDETSWPDDLLGDCHHMGTTRMSDDPRRGVVDENSRVHGISNLFIGGCSVFPTGGYVPPTRTIVALALRLGDHLRSLAA